MTTEQQEVRIKAAVAAERLHLLEWLREECLDIPICKDHENTYNDGYLDAINNLSDYIWDCMQRECDESRSWSTAT